MKADIHQYAYDLPEERIAKFPLPDRDASKLLIWRQGHIHHGIFRNIHEEIPDNALLVFNNSKVIPARMHFKKDTGAKIEVFLLEPRDPNDISTAMQSRGECTWKCLIGNRKKWKQNDHLTTELDFNDEKIVLSVSRKHEASDEVSFQWSGKVTFSELIEKTGQTPLPPYLKRPALPLDRTRYQTIYSENDGAVAAPTAGLHFTPRLMQQLIDKGIGQEFITLHVSAGTFKPVKEADYRNHDMHSEQIQVSSKSLENIIHHKGQVIAVGTTSLRILESLYWMGFKIYKKMKDPFHIDKLMPYRVTGSELLPTNDALGMIAEHLSKNNSTILKGETEIFIFPGYDFKICNGLITNYHMPQSTLLLLIAAFTDNDWKKIYHEALRKNYRFLSYGDSSLLLR